MMKTILKACGTALLALSALALSICGITQIQEDFEKEPIHFTNENGIREVYAWYYEEGTIEDSDGQLWWWDEAMEEGQMWKLWIDDNGTPNYYEDDTIVDYAGG